MQFKDLEWKDIISDNKIIRSRCYINVCGWISIEFEINYQPKEENYNLYCFGKGNIAKLQPEKYDSIESAKNAAYRIYNNEMNRIKKTIDYLIEK